MSISRNRRTRTASARSFLALEGHSSPEVARAGRRVGVRRRGWLVRRALVTADLVGLVGAFLAAEWLFGENQTPWQNALDTRAEALVFLATLPVWILVAKLYGLYSQDEERTGHSTADEIVSVFHMVTVGAWVLMACAWVTGLAQPQFAKLLTFWALAVVLVAIARSFARQLCRRSDSYSQNALIVGTGPVGTLVARKLLQHLEYALRTVGFVSSGSAPSPILGVPVVGGADRIASAIAALDVDRVIVTPDGLADDDVVQLVHDLKGLDVQIDIVPRTFEVIGPRADLHSIEGVPVIGLPPTRLPRSALAMKRSLDVVGALLGLIVTAPLIAYAAWRIRRESPGPIFFRQTRRGLDQREFTMLKFRTMTADAGDDSHREYIASIMSRDAKPEANGLFKLERHSEITPFGRWLRKTSLDELPQLINVLRGDMSLVGPRPCLPYEIEHFKPHHFERFNVPPGMTGLWQVTARAHSTFLEALEMDVAYARGWSIGLDLRLLMRTPLQILTKSGTT